eukprot:TRINITY_DN1946_c0_g2_i1.p1 TRINITY_DN1946_c0_g2~~TRINITY_DN1946_c0_g2_i1.p1  ORF type:complete len:222 (-),score=36.71 TRINITY_DN1946_c0_g2_i1:147-812(-)
MCATTATKFGLNVLYIDSSCSFTARRLLEIMEAQCRECGEDLTEEEVEKRMKKIRCVTIFDALSLCQFLHELHDRYTTQQMTEEYEKLVIIDSLGAVLSTLIAPTFLAGRSLMTQIGRLIKLISSKFHVAFLTSNFTVGSGGVEGSKPALGSSWPFIPHNIIFLSPTSSTPPPSSPSESPPPSSLPSSSVFTACLRKSSSLPSHCVVRYQINECGIVCMES